MSRFRIEIMVDDGSAAMIFFCARTVVFTLRVRTVRHAERL